MVKYCLDKSHRRRYCDAFDAYYCEQCDIWLEPKCGEKDCFCCCEHRPEKPSSWYNGDTDTANTAASEAMDSR